MTDMQQLQPQQQMFQSQNNSMECIQLTEMPLMDFTTTQQQQQQPQQTFTNFSNDDVKLLQQQDPQSQGQQQSQAQVHTIMLNGQPALFIPASSSDILCQMLMNSNSNQIYQIIQPQQQQFQLQLGANGTANGEFANMLNGMGAQQGGTAMPIQLTTTQQNGGITFLQLPTVSTTSNGGKLSNDEIFIQPSNSQGNFLQTQTNNGQTPPPAPTSGKKPRRSKTIRNLTQKQENYENESLLRNVSISQIRTDGDNDDFLTFDDIKLHDGLKSGERPQPTPEQLQKWLIQDSHLHGEKRKRKACDCPNCIRWRQNCLMPEEMNKKRTHKCHKCHKEYNKTSHLRAHLRAHDNYRPYVCDFKSCGKSFTRSDELKRHKRIHNDDRNFPCQICKKRFLRSDHLSKHLLVHNKAAANSAASTSSSSPSSSSLLIKINAIE